MGHNLNLAITKSPIGFKVGPLTIYNEPGLCRVAEFYAPDKDVRVRNLFHGFVAIDPPELGPAQPSVMAIYLNPAPDRIDGAELNPTDDAWFQTRHARAPSVGSAAQGPHLVGNDKGPPT